MLCADETRAKLSDVMSHEDCNDDDAIGIDMIIEIWNYVSKELFVLLENRFSKFKTEVHQSVDLPLHANFCLYH